MAADRLALHPPAETEKQISMTMFQLCAQVCDVVDVP